MAGFRPRLALAGTQDEGVLTVFEVGREHDSSRVMQSTAVAMVEIVFFEGTAIDAGLDGARVGAGKNKGADGPAGELQAAFAAGSVSAEEFFAAEASPEAAAYFSPFGDVVLPAGLDRRCGRVDELPGFIVSLVERFFGREWATFAALLAVFMLQEVVSNFSIILAHRRLPCGPGWTPPNFFQVNSPAEIRRPTSRTRWMVETP